MLTQSVIRTDDVPPRDRFAFWQECMTRTMAPMEMSAPRPGEFRARKRLLYLDDITLWPTDLGPSRYRRTPRLIRRSDPGLLHMTLVLPGSGTIRVDHAGHRSVNEPYDLYFLDTSRPYDVQSDGERRLVGVGVEIPRSRLGVAGEGALTGVLGRRISGRRGFGGLLTRFLTQLCEESDAYRSSDAPRLNGVLLDLVTGLISHELDSRGALPPETRDRHLVLAVRSFVGQHFRDPGLTARAVAAAHHVSPRQLHRLFQPEGVTVAGLIRRQRLEQARRFLADPALATASVHTIATRSGFTAPAHFSRSFRTAYGTSPTDYRRSALHHSTALPGPGPKAC
ncbi:helix-turn-helix domain-containing protein [Streptomyces sp. LE64]|uniref:helix-turn-helix domain-containing protein n=1 Tax=Streptomyces sp. LE64 TaxID=3448653 RepID=UPI004042CD5B